MGSRELIAKPHLASWLTIDRDGKVVDADETIRFLVGRNLWETYPDSGDVARAGIELAWEHGRARFPCYYRENLWLADVRKEGDTLKVTNYLLATLDASTPARLTGSLRRILRAEARARAEALPRASRAAHRAALQVVLPLP